MGGNDSTTRRTDSGSLSYESRDTFSPPIHTMLNIATQIITTKKIPIITNKANTTVVQDVFGGVSLGSVSLCCDGGEYGFSISESCEL